VRAAGMRGFVNRGALEGRERRRRGRRVVAMITMSLERQLGVSNDLDSR
jgi:hypothetical protein